MTTTHSTTSTSLPPPTVGTEVYGLNPPDGYSFRGREALATAPRTDTLGVLAAAGHSMTTLEVMHPEYTRQVRIPSWHDRELIWLSDGSLAFNLLNGEPMRWTDRNLVPGSKRKPGQNGVMTDIEGNVLVPAFSDKNANDPNGPQNKPNIRTRLGNMLYNAADKHYAFMEKEASMNEEWKKIVETIKNNGDDYKYRILWSEWNPQRQCWQKYNGTPLTAMEVTIMLRERKNAKANPGYALACGAYEIIKREEQRQAGQPGDGALASIMNTMFRDLRLDPWWIGHIHQGQVFTFKKENTFDKHRKLLYVDANGVEFDPTPMSRGQLDRLIDAGAHIKLGDLKERDFVTEITDKFKAHDMIHSPATVAQIINFAREIERRLDSAPNLRSKNLRNYQNALWVAQKLYTYVSESRMSMDPDDEKLAQMSEQQQLAYLQQIERQNGMYQASMFGSAGAKKLWKLLAKQLDVMAARHPLMKVVSETEYDRSGRGGGFKIDTNV